MAWSFVGAGGFPGCAVLALRGELDISNADELSSRLAEAMSRELSLVVDLAGLEFMDCSSLGVLAGARERARQAGGDVLLAGPRGVAARVLALTGQDKVFSVFPAVGPAAFSVGLGALGARAGRPEAPMVTVAAALPP
jgi:anti-anti-sigma factor